MSSLGSVETADGHTHFAKPACSFPHGRVLRKLKAWDCAVIDSVAHETSKTDLTDAVADTIVRRSSLSTAPRHRNSAWPQRLSTGIKKQEEAGPCKPGARQKSSAASRGQGGR